VNLFEILCEEFVLDILAKIGYNMYSRRTACKFIAGGYAGGTEKTMADLNTPMDADEVMDAPELYTLVNEDGEEKLFELIDVMEEGDKVYFALIPHIENPEELLDGEVELVVLSVVTGEDGSDILEPIESDEEYERIAQLFLERLDEDCECEDEDCDCHHHHE